MKFKFKIQQYQTDAAKEANAIKAILGSLRGIASQIAIIRNAYGSGHGKAHHTKVCKNVMQN